MEPDNLLQIIYEDNHIVVAEKPSGVLTQGDISGEISLLDMVRDHVKKKYGKPGEAFIGLVHRLDRPVSGLLVFARTSKAASRLHADITSGQIEKYYIAITDKSIYGDPNWHKTENFVLRVKDMTIVTPQKTGNSQKAVLYCTEILNQRNKTLMLIKLETGRKHQIRAQLAGSGAPVTGDLKYGSKKKINKGICLHSVFLAFHHPVKKNLMEFYSSPPGYFREIVTFEPDELRKALLDKISEFRSHALLSKTVPFSSGG